MFIKIKKIFGEQKGILHSKEHAPAPNIANKEHAPEPYAPRKDYINKTIAYCKRYAEFVAVKEKVESGEVIHLTKDEMEQLITGLSSAREEFIAGQHHMGYTTGDNFLNDNNFRGFCIQNGQLIGDSDCFYRIILPWMEEFYYGLSDNHFRFEIATFLYWLKEVREERQV